MSAPNSSNAGDASNPIKREAAIFLVVGGLTVVVDYLSYRLLSAVLNLSLAKGTGFLCGTLFAYWANRRFTFGKKTHAAHSSLRFALLYSLTLLGNVAINAAVLHWSTSSQLSSQLPALQAWGVQLAFFIATGASALCNFIGMKWFVFTPLESV